MEIGLVIVATGAGTAQDLLLLAVIILIGPALAERIRLPGMIGLIALGTIAGPYVLGWMQPDSFIAEMGEIGLLYLMFLAGLELNMRTFLRNRTAAIVFGLLTFACPMVIATIGAIRLDFAVAASLLIGSMWASHTLVSYPEIKGAGMEKAAPISVAVGATVITDTLALTVLAVVVSVHSDTGGSLLLLPVALIALTVYALVVLPAMGRWAFRNAIHTRTSRFVFLLAGMASAAVIADLGGIEGMVGSFLAGLGMNQLIPGRGPLMERVDFFGSALFVPAFLVSIGISVDPAALASWSTLGLAAAFTLFVLVGKAAAVLGAKLLFGYDWWSVATMWALTIGQAAATLATAQVGFQEGIFDQRVVNAAVVTVVVTVVITSLATRAFAARMVSVEEDVRPLGSHVLALAPEPLRAAGFMKVAAGIAWPDGGVVQPAVVVTDTSVPDSLETGREYLEAAEQAASAAGADVAEGVLRIDETEASGILRAVGEHGATLVMVPWSGALDPGSLLFGSRVDAIGSRSPVPVAVARITGTDIDRVVVVLPKRFRDAPGRRDIALTFAVVRRLVRTLAVPVVVYGAENAPIADLAGGLEVEFRVGASGTGRMLRDAGRNDLVVLPVEAIPPPIAFATLGISNRLGESSILVLGGAYRMVMSRANPHRTADGLVGSTK